MLFERRHDLGSAPVRRVAELDRLTSTELVTECRYPRAIFQKANGDSRERKTYRIIVGHRDRCRRHCGRRYPRVSGCRFRNKRPGRHGCFRVEWLDCHVDGFKLWRDGFEVSGVWRDLCFQSKGLVGGGGVCRWLDRLVRIDRRGHALCRRFWLLFSRTHPGIH